MSKILEKLKIGDICKFNANHSDKWNGKRLRIVKIYDNGHFGIELLESVDPTYPVGFIGHAGREAIDIHKPIKPEYLK